MYPSNDFTCSAAETASFHIRTAFPRTTTFHPRAGGVSHYVASADLRLRVRKNLLRDVRPPLCLDRYAAALYLV